MRRHLGWVSSIFVLLLFSFFSYGKISAPGFQNTPKSTIMSFNKHDNSQINNANDDQYNPKSNKANDTKTSTLLNGRMPKSTITLDGKTYPNRVYKTMTIPNDPLANQWWVQPNGMEQVWSAPKGLYQTKVAIIDTGFALRHTEFTDRWAINSNESGPTTNEGPSKKNCSDLSLPLDKSCNLIDDDYDGQVDNESGLTTIQNPSDLNCTDQNITLDKSCNNIDDDSNFYVDDISGWDFANNDSSVQAGEINPIGSGTTHGTMTSGVLGATGNNGIGLAGVNWQTKILPLQALDDDSYGDSYTVGQAIFYAADQGADVISISLGTNFDDPYMRRAILYALDRGSIVVASSGNSGCNCISYPANYPEVIAVGAINPSGIPASFSSYGDQLDVLAPGQAITTTTFTASNQTNAYVSNVAGTSFSTPFFSGILALAKSYQPNTKWEELVGVLLENSDRKTLSINTPRSDTLGFGATMAQSMINRVSTPKTYNQRLQLDNLSLGSNNIFQCDGPDIPATKFYELKKSGNYQYTASARELSKSVQSGWTSTQLGYACVGLGSDLIQTLRVINLPSEIHNLFTKQ